METVLDLEIRSIRSETNKEIIKAHEDIEDPAERAQECAMLRHRATMRINAVLMNNQKIS